MRGEVHSHLPDNADHCTSNIASVPGLPWLCVLQLCGSSQWRRPGSEGTSNIIVYRLYLVFQRACSWLVLLQGGLQAHVN